MNEGVIVLGLRGERPRAVKVKLDARNPPSGVEVPNNLFKKILDQ
jgi:hypothetical protein